MSNVHTIAVSGFATGTNDLYDRSRPSYPAGSLQQLHRLLPEEAHQRGLKILEPGAGTGIFSRLLVAPPSDYPAWNIKALIGVEPSAGMRQAWDQGMQNLSIPSSATVKTVDGTFADFAKAKEAGIEEGSADLIIIAQAWHWCPDHEAAFTEMAKYLSPTGVLVFIWNLESEQVEWQRQVRELYQPFDKGTPQYWKGLWKEGFKTEAFKQNFEAPEDQQVSWYRAVDDQKLIDTIMSKSYLTETHLNGEDRDNFIQDFKKLLKGVEAEKDFVDQEKGTYQIRYDTNLVVMRKKT